MQRQQRPWWRSGELLTGDSFALLGDLFGEDLVEL